MITVTRDTESPPRGWRITVPQTGLLVQAPYFSVLKGRVAAHLRANSIELPDDFEAWCADAACRESGHGSPFCGGVKPKPQDSGMPMMNLATAKRFLRTVYGAIKDRKFVDRAEAERRAAICLNCPLHTNTNIGCTLCSAIFIRVKKALKSYQLDPNLGWCSACGCLLSAKNWLDQSTLDAAELERPAYVEGCWRNS